MFLRHAEKRYKDALAKEEKLRPKKVAEISPVPIVDQAGGTGQGSGEVEKGIQASETETEQRQVHCFTFSKTVLT